MVLYNQKDMLESLDEASCVFVDLINFRSDFMDAVDLNAVVFRNGLFYSNTNKLLLIVLGYFDQLFENYEFTQLPEVETRLSFCLTAFQFC